MRPAHAWVNRAMRCASSSVSSDGTFGAVSMHVVSIRWRQALEVTGSWESCPLSFAKFGAKRQCGLRYLRNG